MGIEVLKGLTLKSVRRIADERIEFETVDGVTYYMQHHQDCCENVYIENVYGDLNDLVGHEIFVAEERVSDEFSEKGMETRAAESQTWTFYTLRTHAGTVDIRWYGSSNGYYSERVSFGVSDNGWD